ncbi:hypothetical protein [Glycomyces harbinensis]|uniref:Uncharacterized protein n=1 Tax=Glycomyces harbinensis TaxID=58114 RepID=A0A1G6Z4K4_9ACTN|nr:hypothetical protein [Glycomyces harbinensis]SDD97694.1 hypothetical protein SAMN05216270_11058 [Glycomyces harbinensis]
MQRTTTAGLIGLAVILAATAACSDDSGADAAGGDGEPAGAGEEFDGPRLVDMVNESARLQYELESAEIRIIKNCMELQGFTVHDQFWFTAGEPAEQDALFGADDWGDWIPEVEEAAEFGLGHWAYSDEGQSDDALEAYYEHQGIDPSAEEAMASGDGGGGAMPDNSAFEALSPQEQYDWYVAYWGEEAAAQENGYLIGEDRPDSGGEATDGEIELGGDFDYVQAEPGGCQREMIDALYDDLQLVVDSEGEGDADRTAVWTWVPVNPVDDFAVYEEFDVLYGERLAAVQGELVDCLAEHGRPGWEFDEEGSLPISDYLYELYDGEVDVHEHPDLPGDAPSDYEGKKAFEIAFAVELAECGDETGYRETAAQAWADTQNEYYLSIETSVYAWQDQIRGILETAQEVIGG